MKVMKYFWQFAKNYKKSFFAMFIFHGIAITVGFLLTPIILKGFLDTIVDFSGTDKAEIYPQLINYLLLFLGAEIIAFWIFARGFDFTIVYFSIHFLRDIENYCFKKLHNHSFDFFANKFVGSLVSKAQKMSRSMDRMIDIIHLNFFPNFLKFIVSIIVIFYYEQKISIILFFWFIIYFGVILFLTIKYRIPRDLENSKVFSKTTGALADTITNAITIKMFARIKNEIKRYADVINKLFYARKKAWNTHQYINIFQSIMITSLQLLVMYIIIQDWMQNKMTIGTIILINVYLAQIYGSLWGFSNIIKDFSGAMADAEQMIDIVEKPLDTKDIKNPEKCQFKKGKIEFRNINFTYEQTTKVFQNFNLIIEPGKKIGLVGESGAGKTTIIKMILRFANLDNGQILIDNQNINKITQDDLRKHISYVPQEPLLFHRTLFENIKYGNLKATNEEIQKATKNAHADEFIKNCPQGYETFVGERGVKLSGGERQRVAIARAMLKNTPILILDEATSALDSHAEGLIQDALQKLMKDRTTIVIAHRLSTLKKMDEIIVLENGDIQERGSHNELLDKKGKYADLWNHQVGGFM